MKSLNINDKYFWSDTFLTAFQIRSIMFPAGTNRRSSFYIKQNSEEKIEKSIKYL